MKPGSMVIKQETVRANTLLHGGVLAVTRRYDIQSVEAM